MGNHGPPNGVHKSGSELSGSQHKDGNTICYMIYKVLKIKINQLLKRNTSIPGLERNSSLDQILKKLQWLLFLK